MDLDHPYVAAMLGQRDPPKIEMSPKLHLPTELLRADSLWASNQGAEAIKILDDLEANEAWDSDRYGPYANGLRGLVKGDLDVAYRGYVDAAAKWPDVFASERAVNIAFWMACAGKMHAAGCLLSPIVESKPFAGGVLAFAQHMTGKSELAESTAKSAIAKGFDDPWTIHAVAHSMYSLGRSKECAQWLMQHRDKASGCSTFMKTHMEFHLAMCLIDLEDRQSLADLCAGPLWGSLTSFEQGDFWAATGVLNALWKAELRDVSVDGDVAHVSSALKYLVAADVQKSKVFSLVILRWLSPEGSASWLAKIRAGGHEVFTAVADAIESVYIAKDWDEAGTLLMPVLERLPELGASPEQREVIEEFAGVVLAHSRHSLDAWLQRNRRPYIDWYDKLQQSSAGKRRRTCEKTGAE